MVLSSLLTELELAAHATTTVHPSDRLYLGDASSHSCGDQRDVPQGIRADFRNRGSHLIDLALQLPVVHSDVQVKTQTPRSPI